ncbi:ABC transporter ATP-binding protein [Gimesia maris]|uniref:Macrolide export ATP-binding/permease protein MacB n=1 Tax=Gimesia maris TaxID=122 RepID=A0ABX5YM40_9PLAN|nr:ABC transporter ATP-binding protein [Gimesia maris]MAC52619.1 ABC transporter ATP-binding protein [Gimesia sp.]EDL59835.1 ABC transporter-related protein [Gimesia maris DSM 8797]QDT79161.1 Macrolide export ATP-binding/permease protein MacB [Gimesia maris]QDU14700.1 Macrolide export ATP-binding/permease protein MacB [Gimesia maris]QEG16677.1 Macrolide export ATP-binding/permease protein MacB [Gimesia maris]|tara:strand:+ start:26468 stop:27157 length:690 start_codon:yes stop_codon:yes gene_type:complete
MLLELKALTKSFKSGSHRVQAVDGVSLSIDGGEFVAIQGPSGCGKSTLLLMVGGLLSPDSGQVLIENTDPYALSNDQRARFRSTHLGFVFQQFHLVPYLNVLDNVLAPALATRLPESRQRAAELINKFGLEPRLHHTPAELSTGEKQRVALARALFHQPKVLLADEPTGNLDAENSEIVLNVLNEFAQNGGCVLMVSHDDQAVQSAQRVLGINAGRLSPQTEKEALINS